jgi:hypothetical protein
MSLLASVGRSVEAASGLGGLLEAEARPGEKGGGRGGGGDSWADGRVGSGSRAYFALAETNDTACAALEIYSVSFPGCPVPDFPGSRRFCQSRFPGKSVRDSREKDLLSKNVYSSTISGCACNLLKRA